MNETEKRARAVAIVRSEKGQSLLLAPQAMLLLLEPTDLQAMRERLDQTNGRVAVALSMMLAGCLEAQQVDLSPAGPIIDETPVDEPIVIDVPTDLDEPPVDEPEAVTSVVAGETPLRLLVGPISVRRQATGDDEPIEVFEVAPPSSRGGP